MRSVAAVLLACLLTVHCSRGPSALEGEPPLKPVATVDELMDAIVIPSSQAIFDAVVYSNGELVKAPQSDDDWFRLRIHALAVAEAGNLLMLPPRAKDGGDWMKMALALNDRAIVVAKAADAKDLDALLKAGGQMYNTCTACHEKYVMGQEEQ
jgi:hypothetical protein